MKTFYFKENDNIYKIFQVIEKLPKRNKEVIFDINVNNNFFKNKWWLKLVLEKASEKKIKIVFIIENYKQETLMKVFGVNYLWRKIPIIKKINKFFGDFLENFKSEHSFYQKHYNIFRIIFLFLEVCSIVFMVFYIYNLVVPKTDIYIQQAIKLKHLVQRFYIYPKDKKEKYRINNSTSSFPYVQKTFTKTYSIKIPVDDISYIAKPSEGEVKIVNTTTKGFSLKPYTEIITVDGLLFRLKSWVYVSGKDVNGNPGVAKVLVKAEQKDRKGDLIGIRGNLNKGTKLYIKRIYASSGKKLIYAEVVNRFSGGETDANGTVQLGDIKIIKKLLLKTFKENLKQSIIQYSQSQKNQEIPLLYNDLYGYNNVFYNLDTKVGDKIAFIKGDIQGKIFYKSINKEYIKTKFKDYLNKRIVSKNEFLGWDNNNIEVLNLKKISNGLYLITVSIDALLGYDFSTDYNNIRNQIINEIKGKNLKKAKNIILSNSVVAGVNIKTTNTMKKVSDLKSRIFIHIAK